MSDSKKNPFNRALAIEKPLAFVDLETTGTIIGLDRIVDIGVLKKMPDGTESVFQTLLNPEMLITSEALKIHGIDNMKVQRAPTFEVISPELTEFLEGVRSGWVQPTEL